jgi:arsenate reductase (thioredoxin)
MSDKIYNVLFLCKGNSARSILAEAQLNALGHAHFRAHSAGSQPAGAVHPATLALLHTMGLPADTLRSKSWDEFAAPGAPVMDFIITVCDQLAGEACPIGPGHPVSANWSVPDPVLATGSEDHQHHVFVEVAALLRRRIALLTALPFASLDHMSLTAQVQHIGADTGPAPATAVGAPA